MGVADARRAGGGVGAWPFHRAAWVNARHGAATMDTLISIGVGAAFLWSLYALFLGGAGMPGMTMGFEWFAQPGEHGTSIYLEVASAVTVFILLGRYLEARAKSRVGRGIAGAGGPRGEGRGDRARRRPGAPPDLGAAGG